MINNCTVASYVTQSAATDQSEWLASGGLRSVPDSTMGVYLPHPVLIGLVTSVMSTPAGSPEKRAPCKHSRRVLQQRCNVLRTSVSQRPGAKAACNAGPKLPVGLAVVSKVHTNVKGKAVPLHT